MPPVPSPPVPFSPRWMQFLAANFAILLLGVVVDWDWVAVGTYDIDGLVGVLAALGAVSAWMASQKRMMAPYTAETLVAVSGIVLALLFVTGKLGFIIYLNPVSLSAVAMLLVFAGSLRVAMVLSKLDGIRLQPTDDATLALALLGAAAILLSIFGLAWFTFDGFEEFSVKFRDFVDAYEVELSESGSVNGLRLLYFEWGYVVSLVAGVGVAAAALRGRKNPLPANVAVKWLVVGATVVMGVWQAFLVLGLNGIEDGSVGAGAWLGIVGHVLTIVATLRLANIKRAQAAAPAA